MKFLKFNPKEKEIALLSEGNTDCVIRAIMLAMNTSKALKAAKEPDASEPFVTWEEAYDLACKKGREIYAMPDTFDVLDAILADMGYTFIEYTGTAAKLAEDYPVGCLILDMPLHNAALINGVLHDTEDCGRRKLYGFWDNPDERAKLEKIHKDEAIEEPKARRRGHTEKKRVFIHPDVV